MIEEFALLKQYIKYSVYALIGGAIALSFAHQDIKLSAYLIIFAMILSAVIIWDWM